MHDFKRSTNLDFISLNPVNQIVMHGHDSERLDLEQGDISQENDKIVQKFNQYFAYVIGISHILSYDQYVKHNQTNTQLNNIPVIFTLKDIECYKRQLTDSKAKNNKDHNRNIYTKIPASIQKIISFIVYPITYCISNVFTENPIQTVAKALIEKILQYYVESKLETKLDNEDIQMIKDYIKKLPNQDYKQLLHHK